MKIQLAPLTVARPTGAPLRSTRTTWPEGSAAVTEPQISGVLSGVTLPTGMVALFVVTTLAMLAPATPPISEKRRVGLEAPGLPAASTSRNVYA